MTNTQQRVVLAVAGLLLVAASAYAASEWRARGRYSAIYLQTGEIYVAKLKTFPMLRMSDIWLVQSVRDATDETKVSIQLVPLKNTDWATRYLNLNRGSVVFYGPLEESSRAALALRDALAKEAASASPAEQPVGQ